MKSRKEKDIKLASMDCPPGHNETVEAFSRFEKQS